MVSTRVSHEAMNYIEAIANLAYLIRLDAENPAAVQAYAEQVEERVLALGAFLHSVTRELKEVNC